MTTGGVDGGSGDELTSNPMTTGGEDGGGGGGRGGGGGGGGGSKSLQLKKERDKRLKRDTQRLIDMGAPQDKTAMEKGEKQALRMTTTVHASLLRWYRAWKGGGTEKQAQAEVFGANFVLGRHLQFFSDCPPLTAESPLYSKYSEVVQCLEVFGAECDRFLWSKAVDDDDKKSVAAALKVMQVE